MAATIGDVAALEAYQHCLRHTQHITAQPYQQVRRTVWYDAFIDTNDDWDNCLYDKHLQQGNDLGTRMLHAFEVAFAQGATAVVIIGSDCPYLQIEHLQQAFDTLQTYPAVIGEATDGGYYLLGMTRCYPSLFTQKAWSSPRVFADTLADCRALGLTVYQLPTLSDIDTEADWREYLWHQAKG